MERSDGNENVNGSSIANSEIKLKSKKNMTVNEVNRYEAMRTDEVEN